MAKQAFILHQGTFEHREQRLGRILDFFGVPWKQLDVSTTESMEDSFVDCAAFGSVQVVAAMLNQECRISSRNWPTAFYAYTDDDRGSCSDSVVSIWPEAKLSLKEAPTSHLSVSISEKAKDIAGPMAGLNVSIRLKAEDAILSGVSNEKESAIHAIMSAEGEPIFVRFPQRGGAPVFLCTSSHIVDVNEAIQRGFYDVKDHFCSVVPLVMFIRFMFPEVVWQPQEVGACLIIDDPLLRLRYGFCDFSKLRDLMQSHGFTTNIAFIPWNWRRTSPCASEFFKNEAKFFSVSIHGCDHTASEFGALSLEVLHSRARLAQSRMRNHQARTGIRHDSIMVFPQGVFSSSCPAVLQSHEFIAAVNSEIVPIDSHNTRTTIRDAWDVAIMAYDGFPIFTRRYAFHGLENFAFDLLLGKPCLIVAHHDFLKDGGAALIDLIQKIRSRNCSVNWRPLGEVIQRSCRCRFVGPRIQEIEMYGSELIVRNPTDQMIEVRIRKRKSPENLVSEILCDGIPVSWNAEVENYCFGGHISPWSEREFRVVHRDHPCVGESRRSLRFEVAVGARRILSEFRDNYIATSRFLGSPLH